MKYSILAVFLAVSQASSPIPRKTSDHAANGGQSIEDKSKEHEPVAVPPMPAVNAKKAPNTEQKSGNTPTENTFNAVTIRELSPVSIQRDWADWGYWVFVGLLVIVALLQIWLVLRTLGATKRLADGMEIALKDWVIVRDWTATLRHDKDSEQTSLNVSFDVANPTKLPLTIFSVEMLLVGLGNFRHDCGSTLLMPDQTYAIDLSIPVTAEQVRRYIRDDLVFTVFASILYEDVSEEPHIHQINGSLECGARLRAMFTPVLFARPQLPSRQLQRQDYQAQDFRESE